MRSSLSLSCTSSKRLRVLLNIALILLLSATVATAETLYVDDDKAQYPSAQYTDIQSAVNAAHSGDTVVVYPGSYSSVTVNKQLTLRGINYPVIKVPAYSNGIILNANDCVVEGFTITNAVNGILVNANSSIVKNNIVKNNEYGIHLFVVVEDTITNNVVEVNSVGIYSELSGSNVISNNYINNNVVGVHVDASDENEISGNSINNNQNEGILLTFSNDNTVKNNKVGSNNRGIYLYGSAFNTINENTFNSNNYGIRLESYVPRDPDSGNINGTPWYTDSNIIYLNNFVNSVYNQHQIINTDDVWNTEWSSIEEISYTYNNTPLSSRLGNYWSDASWYDNNKDGIYDSNYPIDDNNDDFYPLVNHWEIYFGEIYNIPPNPEFTYSPTNPYVNVEVEFNADSSSDPDGYIQSYEWDFGDGATDSGNLVWHTYTIPGKYTVKLTVTDNNGTSNSIADVIYVQPPDTTPPSLQIWPHDGYVTSNNWIVVSAYANEDLGEATLHWDGSNYGMDVTGKTAQYNVTGLSDGDYSFYVSAEDLSGNHAQTDTYTITVDTTPPVITILSPPNGSVTTSSEITVLGEIIDESGIKSMTQGHTGAYGGGGGMAKIEPPYPKYIPINWTISLYKGMNIITIGATDLAGNKNFKSLTVFYHPLTILKIEKGIASCFELPSFCKNPFVCVNKPVNITALNVKDLANFDLTIAYNPSVVIVKNATVNPVFGIPIINLVNASEGRVRIATINTETGQDGDVWLGTLIFDSKGYCNDISLLNITVNLFINSSEKYIPVKVENSSYQIKCWNTGDLNCDGEVDIKDAIYLAKYVVGIPGYEICTVGDVNNDGEINLIDAIYLAKHIVGIPGYEKLYSCI